MKKYEKVTVEEVKNLPAEITCTKCGKTEVLVGTQLEREIHMDAFQTFNLSFGYGSKAKFDDLKFDLCEDCLFEFVNSFTYAPETSE